MIMRLRQNLQTPPLNHNDFQHFNGYVCTFPILTIIIQISSITYFIILNQNQIPLKTSSLIDASKIKKITIILSRKEALNNQKQTQFKVILFLKMDTHFFYF